VALLTKMTFNLRHHMGLHHPVISSWAFITQGPFEPIGHPACNKRKKNRVFTLRENGTSWRNRKRERKQTQKWKVGRTEIKKIPLNHWGWRWAVCGGKSAYVCAWGRERERERACVFEQIYFQMCDTAHSCVIWLICVCDMTHTYEHMALQGKIMCVTRLVVSRTWFRDTNICVTWLMYKRDVIHSYVWYGSFVWSRGSFIYVIWIIHACDMNHSCVWHGLCICVTWLIHMCDMTHSYVWHDSFICVTWPIHLCAMTHSYVWHDSFTCVIWIIHVCDMAYASVWHGSCICETLLIHMCDMAHSYVWHDSFICVTWLIHMCDMTHSFVCYDSFICVTWLIYMCDMNHSCVWHGLCICVP